MKHDEIRQNEEALLSDLPRREFVGLSVAAGLAAAAGTASGATMEVVETDVDIKMPDGTCDAVFIHPKSGTHPGVLIWTDAFGLRPSFRAMGKRLAAEGYSVLVPNPFYRVAKNPYPDASKVDFAKDRPKINQLMGSVNAPGNPEKDAVAYIEFLDKQKEVNKSKKIGTQGYCMGGPLVVRTSAVMPDRVGAGGSFHGGGLVSDKPESPHLLAPKIKAGMYFGVAKNDDERQPDAKDKLKEFFGNRAEVEVYQSLHGWCVTDMPAPENAPIYNKTDAERAWSKLLALYKTNLA